MDEGRPLSNSDKEKALIQRDIDILNHVLNDIEEFSGKLQQDIGTTNSKKSKKKKEKKKSKKKDGDSGIPDSAFIDIFQKIKYGINLLARLDSNIQNPSPEELVHVFFSTIPFIIQHCPSQDLAMGIVSPLLTKSGLQLLSSSLTKEEVNIWTSLGRAWSTPRSEWPNPESVPPYVPVFYDGWEPPVISPPTERKMKDDQMSQRSQSLHSDRMSDRMKMVQAMYDFNARNPRELTVQKGDVLEVLDENKQWWMVRNNRGDQGHVPSNILEPLDGNNGEIRVQNPLYSRNKSSMPELTERSSTTDVTNWLKQNRFSAITVRCLSVLNGEQLLQLSRQEILSVCPEEGNEVYAMLKDMRLPAETGSNSPSSYHPSQPYFNY
ncbi:epidermal growth factor receptor kinase substrate 8-like [Protopterus annectens]|uniref:epidermal growth factor receptor kinase substrate 8-like n=1 Tax=Protopterus annectens TaxID=7888 RepID=UPI001CFB0275|nr:epidermal growth factor receptor kinase substrate 8-like [Protopterus annectens]